ncbi:hypothetical protein GCM10007049_21350 [Echinicola pacifica]|uniref:DUF4015 domain-containing protein n=1 Tax=Echinicola pacifica TaxID=346377 RepID=A0A918PZH3_9BACT|nr:hypothetical protein [Echinicola pacifica]GGZ28159.1 hypothetical protein GCM10007049_21350 [Echinicola pacifica]
MKKALTLLMAVLLLASCSGNKEQQTGTEEKVAAKIPVHAWMGGFNDKSEEEIREKFTEFKEHGIDALMYNGGHHPEDYKKVGKIAKELGLGFHAWIPTMVQHKTDELKAEWYAVNRNGESALEKPAYVAHYTFLCPNKEGTYNFLKNMYTKVAQVEEVDAIHLDYIRFPDVILARGLWDKYGLTMDQEFPQFDYCYCDDCTGDFKEKTGIDIKTVEDATQVQEWKQYRYDLITSIVNRLADVVHAEGKEINAAVFPGPHSVAMKLVRQEWDKWNLDAVFPMNYNDFYLEDTKWIGEITKEEVASVNGERPIFSGLFICPNPEKKAEIADPEGHGLLPSELGAAIKESMDNGATGICLFTPGRMTDEHWVELKKAIYPTK